MGLELALPIVLLMYGGYRLDVWLGTEPWLMALGALLGVAVGFYGFFKRVLPSSGGAAGETSTKSTPSGDQERTR